MNILSEATTGDQVVLRTRSVTVHMKIEVGLGSYEWSPSEMKLGGLT